MSPFKVNWGVSFKGRLASNCLNLKDNRCTDTHSVIISFVTVPVATLLASKKNLLQRRLSRVQEVWTAEIPQAYVPLEFMRVLKLGLRNWTCERPKRCAMTRANLSNFHSRLFVSLFLSFNLYCNSQVFCNWSGHFVPRKKTLVFPWKVFQLLSLSKLLLKWEFLNYFLVGKSRTISSSGSVYPQAQNDCNSLVEKKREKVWCCMMQCNMQKRGTRSLIKMHFLDRGWWKTGKGDNEMPSPCLSYQTR